VVPRAGLLGFERPWVVGCDLGVLTARGRPLGDMVVSERAAAMNELRLSLSRV